MSEAPETTKIEFGTNKDILTHKKDMAIIDNQPKKHQLIAKTIIITVICLSLTFTACFLGSKATDTTMALTIIGQLILIPAAAVGGYKAK